MDTEEDEDTLIALLLMHANYDHWVRCIVVATIKLSSSEVSVASLLLAEGQAQREALVATLRCASM